MARRKQKLQTELQTFLGLLAGVGSLWLVVHVLQKVPNGSSNAISLVGLLIISGSILYTVVRIVSRIGAWRTLLTRVRETTEQQLESLLASRAQLVRPDPYAKPKAQRRAEEIDYFIERHLKPSLGKRERVTLERNYEKVAGIIGARVETALCNHTALKTFSDDMTPSEFETFCTEELRRIGWDAHVTERSRGRGVDIVAAKNGRRIVLQCKLYARPVGNKSMQEAVAVLSHEKADLRIVVSNNRYTASAQEYAAANRILLLHYRELQNVDDLLKRVNSV